MTKWTAIKQVVEVRPLAHANGEDHLYGDYTPVVLDCGHVAKCNPIYVYRVGDRMSCYRCEHPEGERR